MLVTSLPFKYLAFQNSDSHPEVSIKCRYGIKIESVGIWATVSYKP